MNRVVILMGSGSDIENAKKIAKVLDEFGIDYIFRVASAHKTPKKVLEIIDEYEKDKVVFITIAGRSNALSGLVDANTTKPVIASPPLCGLFASVDVFSSLRMPSGVNPMLVLEPSQAAVAAVKILALGDKRLSDMLKEYHETKRDSIESDDKGLRQDG